VLLRAVAADGTGVEAKDGSFTGLRPDTRYSWSADVGGRTRAAGAFTTAPEQLSGPLDFAVIGDYGSGSDHEYAVARELAAGQPRFILTTGDNSYIAAVPQLLDRNLFEPLREAMGGAPVWATMGEHDLVWRDGQAVTDALELPGEAGRYTMRYGPVQMVLLGLEADKSTVSYARTALSEPGPAVRFVVVHRPIRAGNPILPVLRDAGVAAVFAGHLHRYEREVVEGVMQLTVGTSGQGAGNEDFTLATPGAERSVLDFGLLRVQVTTQDVSYVFVDERGRVLDRDTGGLTGREP
jgi:calcineurin-like phosphoesterase family protein